MNLLSWNCRGAGGPRKIQFLKRVLQAIRANVIFISETKCSFPKSKINLDELPLPNNSFVPARGLSLLWDENTQLQVIRKCRFYFHV